MKFNFLLLTIFTLFILSIAGENNKDSNWINKRSEKTVLENESSRYNETKNDLYFAKKSDEEEGKIKEEIKNFKNEINNITSEISNNDSKISKNDSKISKNDSKIKELKDTNKELEDTKKELTQKIVDKNKMLKRAKKNLKLLQKANLREIEKKQRKNT